MNFNRIKKIIIITLFLSINMLMIHCGAKEGLQNGGLQDNQTASPPGSALAKVLRDGLPRGSEQALIKSSTKAKVPIKHIQSQLQTKLSVIKANNDASEDTCIMEMDTMSEASDPIFMCRDTDNPNVTICDCEKGGTMTSETLEDKTEKSGDGKFSYRYSYKTKYDHCVIQVCGAKHTLDGEYLSESTSNYTEDIMGSSDSSWVDKTASDCAGLTIDDIPVGYRISDTSKSEMASQGVFTSTTTFEAKLCIGPNGSVTTYHSYDDFYNALDPEGSCMMDGSDFSDNENENENENDNFDNENDNTCFSDIPIDDNNGEYIDPCREGDNPNIFICDCDGGGTQTTSFEESTDKSVNGIFSSSYVTRTIYDHCIMKGCSTDFNVHGEFLSNSQSTSSEKDPSVWESSWNEKTASDCSGLTINNVTFGYNWVESYSDQSPNPGTYISTTRSQGSFCNASDGKTTTFYNYGDLYNAMYPDNCSESDLVAPLYLRK